MDLSVIIVSYNTKDMTVQTIKSLQKSLKASKNTVAEIIVVDNNSTDGSVEALRTLKDISLVVNKSNLGFGAANNVGIKSAKGTYTLLLNSDVIADDINFDNLLEYMDNHPKTGVLTIRLNIPEGGIDPASHRGFPTLWRSFCYFIKLEKYSAKIPVLNKFFGGYHLTHKDLNHTHEIDSPTGAFYLTRTDLLREIGGFDESFFMYGEDLDLSYRIKEKGYQVVWYPLYTAVHLKYQSGLQNKDLKKKSKTEKHFYNAMKIFYDKHYGSKHPPVVKKLVHKVIDLKAGI